MKPDNLLPEDEAVRSAYSATRVDDDAPTPKMDSAIRAAARRAVQAGPIAKPNGATPENFLSRYRVPLSAAAVVMLSSSLLMVSVRERPDLGTDAQRATASVTEAPREKPADVVQVPTAEAASAPFATPAPAAPTASAAPKLLAKAANANKPVEAPRQAGLADTRPAPARTQDTQRHAETAQVAAPQAATAPALLPPHSPAKPEIALSAPPAAVAAAPITIVAAEAETSRRAVLTKASPPAPPPPAAPMAAAPRPVVAAPAAEKPTLTMSEPASLRPPAAAKVPAPIGVRGGVRSDLAGSAEPSSATAWVEQLNALQRAGNTNALRAALTQFRVRHPEFALPKELAEFEAAMKADAEKAKPLADNNPPG